ncbi:MAG: phosphoenolpyruvate carboxylase [Halobacteriota archaeon]
MKKIPATMATQHPDSATTYVPVQKEPAEALDALKPVNQGGFGIDEYMIDFEGKMTPYVQTSEIMLQLISEGLALGDDVFVTPRIPSVSQETVFRQLMALMSIMEAYYRIHDLTAEPRTIEVIHPMSESSRELLETRQRVLDVVNLTNKEFNIAVEPHQIRLIPLIEAVPQLITVSEMVSEYIAGCRQLGLEDETLRVMLGRSDAALDYGHIASALSVKLAIADCYTCGEAAGMTIAPILGFGTLPFRGHATPSNADRLLKEFSGSRTITIQSSLRYDYDKQDAIRFVKKMKEGLQRSRPTPISAEKRQEILLLIGMCTKHYLRTFYQVISPVKAITDLFPNQRDRLARKGPVGYSRDVPKPADLAGCIADKTLSKELRRLQVKTALPDLPRAIKFTGALYSIGLPPEIIGTGRGMHEADKRGLLDALLNEHYGSLSADLSFSKRFIRLDMAKKFIPYAALKQVSQDLHYIDEYLIVDEYEPDLLYGTLMETLAPSLQQFVSSKHELLVDEVTQLGLIESCLLKMSQIRGALG